MKTQLEKITIIEGPMPQFEAPHESWVASLAEGPHLPTLAMTRLRTFNGPALVERCWKAWQQDHPIHLEYRDDSGLTHLAEILAARYTEVPEGHVLFLYLRLN